MKPLNKYFDHTNLKQEATEDDIKKLCEEAVKYDFFSVCINSCYVPLAKQFLAGTDIKIVAVVGFPLGAMSTSAKAFEADDACENGADEVDMVINVGALKEGRYEYVRDEMAAVCAIASEHDTKVKVILETWVLTDGQVVKGCKLAAEAGAAFVKTSTGLTKGATLHSIALIKQTLNDIDDEIQIKASGGIRDIVTAMEMIEMGADRIGSSASVSIMKSLI